MRHYLIVVEGGVEPALHGPYASTDTQIEIAKHLHAHEMNDAEDSIFWLDVGIRNGEPSVDVGSFAAQTFEERTDDA